MVRQYIDPPLIRNLFFGPRGMATESDVKERVSKQIILAIMM
jgi:hypothetical protein